MRYRAPAPTYAIYVATGSKDRIRLSLVARDIAPKRRAVQRLEEARASNMLPGAVRKPAVVRHGRTYIVLAYS